MSPSASLLTGFDCLDCQDLAGGGGRKGSRPTTVVPCHFQLRFYGPGSSGEDTVRDTVYSFSARPLNCFFKKHIGKDHLNRSVNMQNKEDDPLRN